MLVVVLGILAKLVVILKLGLRSISKRITSLIFLNIYTPSQHAHITLIDSYNSLWFKIIVKAYSKCDLKIKKALHIHWRKPNLNAKQNHLTVTLSLHLLSPLDLFCLCYFVVFWVSLSYFIFIISVLITLCYYFISL